MKFWRPGITGKLFLAIFATCIVLLISMHWAVRISFERGFIDYIKHGNEQRLQLLSDALGEQYAQHGNWRFLRNNDRFVFQILRSFEHDNSEDKPGPGMPPHGWRTQFWVVDQNNKVLVGPRAPIPPDGTRRPILVNGAEVGAVIDHSCHNLFQRFGEYYSASGRIVNRLSASPLPTGGRTAPGRAQIYIEKTNDTI